MVSISQLRQTLSNVLATAERAADDHNVRRMLESAIRTVLVLWPETMDDASGQLATALETLAECHRLAGSGPSENIQAAIARLVAEVQSTALRLAEVATERNTLREQVRTLERTPSVHSLALCHAVLTRADVPGHGTELISTRIDRLVASRNAFRDKASQLETAIENANKHASENMAQTRALLGAGDGETVRPIVHVDLADGGGFARVSIDGRPVVNVVSQQRTRYGQVSYGVRIAPINTPDADVTGFAART